MVRKDSNQHEKVTPEITFIQIKRMRRDHDFWKLAARKDLDPLMWFVKIATCAMYTKQRKSTGYSDYMETPFPHQNGVKDHTKCRKLKVLKDLGWITTKTKGTKLYVKLTRKAPVYIGEPRGSFFQVYRGKMLDEALASKPKFKVFLMELWILCKSYEEDGLIRCSMNLREIPWVSKSRASEIIQQLEDSRKVIRDSNLHKFEGGPELLQRWSEKSATMRQKTCNDKGKPLTRLTILQESIYEDSEEVLETKTGQNTGKNRTKSGQKPDIYYKGGLTIRDKAKMEIGEILDQTEPGYPSDAEGEDCSPPSATNNFTPAWGSQSGPDISRKTLEGKQSEKDIGPGKSLKSELSEEKREEVLTRDKILKQVRGVIRKINITRVLEEHNQQKTLGLLGEFLYTRRAMGLPVTPCDMGSALHNAFCPECPDELGDYLQHLLSENDPVFDPHKMALRNARAKERLVEQLLAYPESEKLVKAVGHFIDGQWALTDQKPLGLSPDKVEAWALEAAQHHLDLDTRGIDQRRILLAWSVLAEQREWRAVQRLLGSWVENLIKDPVWNEVRSYLLSRACRIAQEELLDEDADPNRLS